MFLLNKYRQLGRVCNNTQGPQGNDNSTSPAEGTTEEGNFTSLSCFIVAAAEGLVLAGRLAYSINKLGHWGLQEMKNESILR